MKVFHHCIQMLSSWQLYQIWMMMLYTENFIILKWYFLQQPPDIKTEFPVKTQISKLKKNDSMCSYLCPSLYWIENQYVMVNM